MRASTAALIAACALTAVGARAEVRVTACAELGAASVEIEGTVSFPIELQRDPAQATSAWLDFTAFDPDNAEEVALSVNGAPQGDLTNLEWNGGANFNNRSSSWSAPLDRTQLVLGDNAIAFIDQADSPFAIERVCITLVDAPVPSPRPARETFCADDVLGNSPYNGQGGNPFEAGSEDTVHVEIDAPVSAATRVGLDLIAYENQGDVGSYTATFTSGGATLAAGFTGAGYETHYLLWTAPQASALLATGDNTLDATADWSGRLWGACFVVEEDVVVDAGPPLDAGEPPVDGGQPPVDAGDPGPGGLDAGAPPVDAGTPRADAGAPPVDAGAGAEDAGVLQPADDAGELPRGDASEPGVEPGAGDPRALLSGDDFSATVSCASAPASGLWPLVGLLGVLWAGRGRRRRLPVAGGHRGRWRGR